MDRRHAFRALYDTGASISVFRPEDMARLRHYGHKPVPLKYQCTLKNASNAPMSVMGSFYIHAYFDGLPLKGNVVVSPEVKVSIVGTNIIRQNNLIYHPATNGVTRVNAVAQANTENFKAEIAEINEVTQEEVTQLATVRVVEDIELQPRMAHKAKLAIFDQDGNRIRRALTGVWDLDGYCAMIIDTDNNGTFRGMLPNSDTKPDFVQAGATAGVFNDVHAYEYLNATTALTKHKKEFPLKAHTTEEKQRIRDILIQKCQHIPYFKRGEYVDMLISREHYFSADNLDLGYNDTVQHEIHIEGQQPEYRQQFRLPYQHLKVIQENVAGWIQAGIIEKANTRNNSPIFCVPKKHGAGLRTVLDFRAINARSVKDKYSIRTIDECLESVGREKSTIFSALDLSSGYWQVPLRKEDRDFTAFTIPGKGQYRWIVTPQGLMGAPATFSRLMDQIMENARNVVTYLDDVLIHSKNHNDHIGHLKEAIDRIGKANLRLNPKKCEFAQTEIQYLGHTITADGVKPGEDKSKALAEKDPPKTIKELRSFIGLANYFRGYIKNFATKTAPLTDLTKTDSTWKGGELPEAAIKAFKLLKKELASRPLMAHPNSEGDYHLYVDASIGDEKTAGGFGAVLLQDQPGRKHFRRPVAYASRRLERAQKNYPAFLLEMAAAVYAMDIFTNYLKGRRFYLYTDHKPLVRLSNVHTKTLNNLHLKMQEMHPIIRHVDGKKNQVADYLSRYHGFINKDQRAQEQVDALVALSHHEGNLQTIDASPFRLQFFQSRDPHIKDTYERTYAQTKDTSTFQNPVWIYDKSWKRNLTTVKGVLFTDPDRRMGRVHTGKPRVIVPQELRKEILHEAHNSMAGGHPGRFKTKETILQEFFWPRMDLDIERHCNQCQECAKFSTKGHNTNYNLQPIPIPKGPNHRVHTDLFGPLKARDPSNNAGSTKKYVMVITDAFTKLARIYTIPNKEAKTTALKLYEDFCLWGIPNTIVTDQGNEWTNELMRNLWEALNIEHRFTTPYHPQSNAAAETFNKTMRLYLAKSIAEAEAAIIDWELFLAPLLFAYNTSVHSQTKITPFTAHFGQTPKTPLWEDMDDATDKKWDRKSFQDILSQLRRTQNAVVKIARNNLEVEQQRYKEQHDQNMRREPDEFTTGDSVWVRRDFTTGENPKLQPLYDHGIIIERKGLNTYEVELPGRKRKKRMIVNASKIKYRADDNYDFKQQYRDTGRKQVHFKDPEEETTESAPPAQIPQLDLSKGPFNLTLPTTRSGDWTRDMTMQEPEQHPTPRMEPTPRQERRPPRAASTPHHGRRIHFHSPPPEEEGTEESGVERLPPSPINPPEDDSHDEEEEEQVDDPPEEDARRYPQRVRRPAQRYSPPPQEPTKHPASGRQWRSRSKSPRMQTYKRLQEPEWAEDENPTSRARLEAMQDREVFEQIVADAYALLDINKPDTYHGNYEDIARRLIAGEWTAYRTWARGGVRPPPPPATIAATTGTNTRSTSAPRAPGTIPGTATNGKEPRWTAMAQLATTTTATTAATTAGGRAPTGP